MCITLYNVHTTCFSIYNSKSTIKKHPDWDNKKFPNILSNQNPVHTILPPFRTHKNMLTKPKNVNQIKLFDHCRFERVEFSEFCNDIHQQIKSFCIFIQWSSQRAIIYRLWLYTLRAGTGGSLYIEKKKRLNNTFCNTA